MVRNIFPKNTEVIFLIFILVGLFGCKHQLSPKEALIQRLKGEWIEVKRTNSENSSFNKHSGTFYSPDWDLTITDSNYLFVKIKDSPTVKKYPYDIFYDSILVLAGRYWNNLYLIKQPDSVHLTLSRLPNKYDSHSTDTLLYHFIQKKYYQQIPADERKSLSKLNPQDTLYVLHLIHSIKAPKHRREWGVWYRYLFTPEYSPTPRKWNKNIKISLDSESNVPFYHITVSHSRREMSFVYNEIDIDTLGRMYIGGYVDSLDLKTPLFERFVAGLTVLCFSFSLPLLSWSIVKPVILGAKAGRRHKLALIRLRHDPKIFQALLPRQKKIMESTEGLGITLGNPHATQKLIKVCNPYCGPCARAHPEIEKILENNPDVSAQIIFIATEKEKDKRSWPVKHLMAIYEKGDKALTKQALDDWYNAEKKDYRLFADKYPLNGELKKQGEKLKAMSDWCYTTGISVTPTFFVDVYQVPDIYSVEDLKYLLV